MGIYIGGFDPLKLIEGIINKLIQRGIITPQEGRQIIEEAKAPSLSKDGKDETKKTE